MLTIAEQIAQVFSQTTPAESPTTIKLYHATIGRNTPCRRVLAHTHAEAALKAGALYPGAYVNRAASCTKCTGEIHWRIKGEQS